MSFKLDQVELRRRAYERTRKWREKNREHLRRYERSRIQTAAQRKHKKLIFHCWYLKNRDRICSRRRIFRAANSAYWAAQSKKWRAENPDRRPEYNPLYSKRKVAELDPKYVRQRIVRGLGLRAKDVPERLVWLKTKLMKLKRYDKRK